MSNIHPEMNMEMARQKKEDQLAKEELQKNARPMEQRMDAEYRGHVQNLIDDLEKGFRLEEINAFEHGEYCVILKHPESGKIRSYGFEAPLNVRLTPAGHAEENAGTRSKELREYLSEMVRGRKTGSEN